MHWLVDAQVVKTKNGHLTKSKIWLGDTTGSYCLDFQSSFLSSLRWQCLYSNAKDGYDGLFLKLCM